jgi:hypothetical protein
VVGLVLSGLNLSIDQAVVDGLSEAAALEEGLMQIARVLGVEFQSLRDSVVAMRRESWAANPHTAGAYGTTRCCPPHAQP